MSEPLFPDAFDAWAATNRPLLELIVERMLATGAWPSERELQRRLVLDKISISVADAVAWMPKPLGYRDGERVVLSLFGLRYVPAAQPLLAGFLDVLRLAAARYQDPDDPMPVLRDTDVPLVVAREIVSREAPFLGNTVPTQTDEHEQTGEPPAWTREITGTIARYLDIETIDAYLTRRRDEQRDSPHLGWPRPTIDEPAPGRRSAAGDVACVGVRQPPSAVVGGAGGLDRSRRGRAAAGHPLIAANPRVDTSASRPRLTRPRASPNRSAGEMEPARCPRGIVP